MTRWILWRTVCLLLPCLLLPAASAAPAEPTVLGRYNDWIAFRATENGETVCYVGSVPKSAKGAYTRRGQAHVAVSVRPGRASNGVVTVEAGYPYKKESRVVVQIDKGKSFELFTRNRSSDGNGDAWADTEADDQALIAAMKAGGEMVVRGRSSRDTLTTDTYSLRGFTRAYGALGESCGP